MTSLKGNRAAQRKRRLKERDKDNHPERQKMAPNQRVRNLNINNLDDFLDDEG